jgi:hypothetical protein
MQRNISVHCKAGNAHCIAVRCCCGVGQVHMTRCRPACMLAMLTVLLWGGASAQDLLQAHLHSKGTDAMTDARCAPSCRPDLPKFTQRMAAAGQNVCIPRSACQLPSDRRQADSTFILAYMPV